MEGIGAEREFISVDEAARELGTTPTRILTLLRSKELAGVESGEGWRVSRPSVSCAKAHGIDRKRSSGCATGCRSSCGCG
jgi:excisionase family DNA binding protein